MKQEAPAKPQPAVAAPVVPPAASNPETPSKAEVETAAAPAETAPATSEEAANPAATLHVSLTAGADAWVQVVADGKNVMSNVLHANAVKTFDAVDAVRVRTGNAGDLQMTVNGKPAGPLGPKGQVRNVEVTRDGVHILAPPPKPAPALEPL